MNQKFLFISLASLLMTPYAIAATDADLYGSPVSPDKNTRVVVIDDRLKTINIRHRDTITLVCGNARVTWHFDGVHNYVPSAKILPPSVCQRNVPIYVEAELHG